MDTNSSANQLLHHKHSIKELVKSHRIRILVVKKGSIISVSISLYSLFLLNQVQDAEINGSVKENGTQQQQQIVEEIQYKGILRKN